MSNLYKARTQLIYLEEKKGITTLNEVVKQTYAFIDNKPTTRAEMLRHPYFRNMSLSTIKRAVTELLELELIKVMPSKHDMRKKYLTTT
jgi:DNA-binding MarR family transcriptional regulator